MRSNFKQIPSIDRKLAREVREPLDALRDQLMKLTGIAGNDGALSAQDLAERELWGKYQAAYQDLLRHTSTKHAPWFVVPADHKWFARLVISSAIVDAMEKLDLAFPAKPEASPAELKKAKEQLEKEGRGRPAVSPRTAAQTARSAPRIAGQKRQDS